MIKILTSGSNLSLSSTTYAVVESTSRIAYYPTLIAFAVRGEVAERLNAPVLKTGIG